MVEVWMIRLGTWLQPFYFGVGLAILVLSLLPSIRTSLGGQGTNP
jgi:hypothetical protein